MPKVRNLLINKDNAILEKTIRIMMRECCVKVPELATIIGKKDRSTQYRLKDVNRFTLGELRKIEKYFGVKLVVRFEEKKN